MRVGRQLNELSLPVQVDDLVVAADELTAEEDLRHHAKARLIDEQL